MMKGDDMLKAMVRAVVVTNGDDGGKALYVTVMSNECLCDDGGDDS